MSEPQVGEEVVVRDDNQPRLTWKLGKLMTIGRSADGNVGSAKVLLPSENIVTQPVNYLCSLEIPAQSHEEENGVMGNGSNGESTNVHLTKRPKRKAAEAAMKLISQYTSDE